MDRELTRAAGEPLDVLVVEDDPDVRALLVRALSAEGYRVKQAASAAEACAALAQAEPDVALLDKNLPDGSGVEVLRWLREHGLNTEAILVTGYASLESAMEAVRLGAFDYVEKPFESLKAVANRVARAAERGRSRRALRERNEALVRALAALEAAQQRLLAARRLATLSETAAGLAHAVKNPLHATLLGLSNARLIAGECGALERLGPSMAGIEANLRHILGLVEGFLRAARAGAAPAETCSGAAAAAEAVERLRAEAQAGELRLELALEAEPAAGAARHAPAGGGVRLSRETLVEAVQNLVRNALQAAPRGGTVRVSVAHATDGAASGRAPAPSPSPTPLPSPAPAASIDIRVEDDGPGFDAESAARAFELFYTTRQDGYGLGLCQVAVAAETAGGRCTIARSAALGGAAVTLTLPLAPAAEER
ncbi:MAG TPA: response regulator [Myxococcota bacterium]|jgi:signal transduction histidine kinase|nr:response regulator [Myxococcota bacterium]